MSLDDDRSPADLETGQPETPDEAIGRLTAELEAQRAEVERLRDQSLRDRADMDNYKKRLLRDQGEALRFAAAPLARDLAGVIDDLERAVEHAAAGGDGGQLVEGVRLVLRNAIEVLARHGITRIPVVAGEAFDPFRHEALASVPVGDGEPNRVVQQFQSGYVLHDRVVRPAKVSVSARGPVDPTRSDA
jgi:molecular chaperone GrpE